MIGRETRPSWQNGTIDQTVVGRNECHDLHQSKLWINWYPSSVKGDTSRFFDNDTPETPIIKKNFSNGKPGEQQKRWNGSELFLSASFEKNNAVKFFEYKDLD